MNQIIIIGNLGGYEKLNRVYSPDGICPTIDTASGGGRQPYFICEVNDERIQDKSE